MENEVDEKDGLKRKRSDVSFNFSLI
jgi:hypothetical protein